MFHIRSRQIRSRQVLKIVGQSVFFILFCISYANAGREIHILPDGKEQEGSKESPPGWQVYYFVKEKKYVFVRIRDLFTRVFLKDGTFASHYPKYGGMVNMHVGKIRVQITGHRVGMMIEQWNPDGSYFQALAPHDHFRFDGSTISGYINSPKNRAKFSALGYNECIWTLKPAMTDKEKEYFADEAVMGSSSRKSDHFSYFQGFLRPKPTLPSQEKSESLNDSTFEEVSLSDILSTASDKPDLLTNSLPASFGEEGGEIQAPVFRISPENQLEDGTPVIQFVRPVQGSGQE